MKSQRSSRRLAAIKGLRSMPILPQNMLFVKENNPKFFKARVAYLIVYFIILIIFMVYAVGGFIAFINTFNQTVLTSTVGKRSEIEYPVVMVCPVVENGLPLDVKKASVSYCGSSESKEYPRCGGYDDRPDSRKNTTEHYSEDMSNCVNNIWKMSFPRFIRDQPSPRELLGCLMFNLDKPLHNNIIKDDIYDDRHTCDWDPPAITFQHKGDKRAPTARHEKKNSVKQARATGTGYRDRYEITFKSRNLRSFSLRMRPKIEDFDIRDADNVISVVPEGSHVAIFLKRVSYTCLKCNDAEIYYNSTMNFFTTGNEKSADDGMSVTTLTFWFDSMTTTFVEEVKTTTTLDYLGNFAGMLGTLLGFAVINYVDRLIAVLFIRDGAVASVWDDPQ
eukprot:TRINITY_DN1729_c0_g1_i6.p1 TRINITY_DN1729_c0_g1~~TRINITY_DN1729_c0_g1_i6.p1  ORF type:complete len:390 (-),score=69.93 TRINITY_DN1729_c0_g1_i6:220-1389(-)